MYHFNYSTKRDTNGTYLVNFPDLPFVNTSIELRPATMEEDYKKLMEALLLGLQLHVENSPYMRINSTSGEILDNCLMLDPRSSFRLFIINHLADNAKWLQDLHSPVLDKKFDYKQLLDFTNNDANLYHLIEVMRILGYLAVVDQMNTIWITER